MKFNERHAAAIGMALLAGGLSIVCARLGLDQLENGAVCCSALAAVAVVAVMLNRIVPDDEAARRSRIRKSGLKLVAGNSRR